MTASGVFIPSGAGRILLVSFEPPAPTTRAVLVVPAFAEEMNKSRRLIYETGSALRRRGLWTLVPDLYGTGDSEGEFEDARWSIWIDDLRCTVEWARARGVESFDVLMVRVGAALFSDAVHSLNVEFDRAVAWEPISGSDVLKQLLRTNIMAIRMSGGTAPRLESFLESLLDSPEPMELSGYRIAPELARALHRAEFRVADPVAVRQGLVLRLESSAAFSAREASDEGAADGIWSREGVVGERFWMAIEPGPNPLLVEATVSHFTR